MIHTDGRPTIANAPRRRALLPAPTGWHAGGVYHEIDSRTAGGVTVEWHLAESGSHLVVVLDPRGTPVAVLKDLDGERAREAFDHPFSLKVVPDIFKAE